MTDDPILMVDTEVTMALAELRWIQSPKDSTKARDLADMKRQGIALKGLVAWFKANPKADWYVGLREAKKGIGYMTPVGDRAVDKWKEKQESDFEAAKKREASLTPEQREKNRRILEEAANKFRRVE